tara:strand:+ start:2851 stop:3711 length:861 start_codon:yes stop_codon:yes gene_type:complete
MNKYIKESGILSTGSTSTGSNVLAPTMVYRTLQEAVRKQLVFRPLAALLIGPGEIPGPAVKVSLQDPDSMSVHNVAEGAELPYGQETYSQITITPAKYGVAIGITREMVEDSMFSVMEKNAQTAGYALADKEDQLVVSTLEAGSTAAGHDSQYTTSMTLADITTSMALLEADGYTPTDLVVGTTVASDIRNLASLNTANLSITSGDIANIRLIGNIFGMNVIVSRNLSNATDAFVIDRNHAFAIAEKRPVTMERFDDFMRDTHNMVATMRIAARYLRGEAISKLYI